MSHIVLDLRPSRLYHRPCPMKTRNIHEELYQALLAEDEPRARALMAEGADINAIGEDNIFIPTDILDTPSDTPARLALRLGADPLKEKFKDEAYNMIYYMLQNGHFRLLLECIDSGVVDVNVTNSRGTTPLMWCCAITCSEWLTSELLKRGASATQEDHDGVNAFGYSLDEVMCYSEHYEQLLNAGADINSRDEYGRTALMVYAHGQNECPDFIEFFLKRGADVNLRSPEGKTALGYAQKALGISRRGLTSLIRSEAWILHMIELLKAYGAQL